MARVPKLDPSRAEVIFVKSFVNPRQVSGHHRTEFMDVFDVGQRIRGNMRNLSLIPGFL